MITRKHNKKEEGEMHKESHQGLVLIAKFQISTTKGQ